MLKEVGFLLGINDKMIQQGDRSNEFAILNEKIDTLGKMMLSLTQRQQLESLAVALYLENCMNETDSSFALDLGGEQMAKRLKKCVSINGEKKWFTGDTEQDVILKAAYALIESGMLRDVKAVSPKHDFAEYANNWFEVYSKPNVAEVTAITYRRQPDNILIPAFQGMNIEDITIADIQEMFNGMKGKKSTKDKARIVLNMIFEAAIEEGYIARNLLQSRTLKIKGEKSRPIEPYSVEEMRYIVSHIADVKGESDRVFLALQAVHPLRLEETLGLRWRDVDLQNGIIRIRQVATHPDRNRAIVKAPKTEESMRDIELVAGAVKYLNPGAEDAFAVGGKEPPSYQQVKRMCERISRDIGFDGKITPRRFRPTVLTDLYDQTKDIKATQAAAGHTTAAMTLEHYVHGRTLKNGNAGAIGKLYGL